MRDRNDLLNTFSDIIYIRAARKINTPPVQLGLLMQSVKDLHVEVFTTGLKKSIGYVAWIVVNKESFLMAHENRKIPPYPFEWNEGHLMIIYDVVYLPGWEHSAGKMLIEFLRTKRFVSFLKRGQLKAFVREKIRHKRFKIENISGDNIREVRR